MEKQTLFVAGGNINKDSVLIWPQNLCRFPIYSLQEKSIED